MVGHALFFLCRVLTYSTRPSYHQTGISFSSFILLRFIVRIIIISLCFVLIKRTLLPNNYTAAKRKKNTEKDFQTGRKKIVSHFSCYKIANNSPHECESSAVVTTEDENKKKKRKKVSDKKLLAEKRQIHTNIYEEWGTMWSLSKCDDFGNGHFDKWNQRGAFNDVLVHIYPIFPAIKMFNEIDQSPKKMISYFVLFFFSFFSSFFSK